MVFGTRPVGSFPIVGGEVAQPLVLYTLLCHGLLLFFHNVYNYGF